MDRIRAWLDPWSDPLRDGFHTIQGLLALGVGGLARERARTEPGRGPERLQRLRLRRDRPGVRPPRRRSWSSCCSSTLAYSGIRVSLRAPDTFGALLAAGITGWLCIQAFINIGVVVALFPVTGHHPAVHQRRRLVAHHQLRRESGSCCRSRARPSRRGHGTTMRLLIVGGGTGGHIYPALAVARSLRARPDAPELRWLGGHRGLEAVDRPDGRHPPAPARGALAADRVELDAHVVLDPHPPGASGPAGRGDPRVRAARGHLHDRRLRGRSRSCWRRPRSASRSCSGTAT